MCGKVFILLCVTLIQLLDEFKSVDADITINSRMGQLLNEKCVQFCEHNEDGPTTGRVLLEEIPKKCECDYPDGTTEKFVLQDIQLVASAASIHKKRKEQRVAETKEAEEPKAREEEMQAHKAKQTEDGRQRSKAKQIEYTRQRDEASGGGEVVMRRKGKSQQISKVSKTKAKQDATPKITSKRSCHSHCIDSRYFTGADFDGTQKTCTCRNGRNVQVFNEDGEPMKKEQKSVNAEQKNGRTKEVPKNNVNQVQKKGKKGGNQPKRQRIDTPAKCMTFCKQQSYKKGTFSSKDKTCGCSTNKSYFANYNVNGNEIM